MAGDQNIIIKLHQKGENNILIAKKLKINSSTVWKIVKKV